MPVITNAAPDHSSFTVKFYSFFMQFDPNAAYVAEYVEQNQLFYAYPSFTIIIQYLLHLYYLVFYTL